jgi:hypothetical protein
MAVVIDWDADRYNGSLTQRSTGLNEAVEKRISLKFPPLFEDPMFMNRPFTLWDCHRRLLMWYLPEILLTERQVSNFVSQSTSLNR